MNTQFAERILHCLDSSESGLLASEVSVVVGAPVEDVRNELRSLIKRGMAFRHHFNNGVLRYTSHKLRESKPGDVPASPENTVKALDDIHAIAGDRNIERRLAALQLIASHIAVYLNHAMTDADAALKRINAEVA